MADYHTKHHSTKHHQEIRSQYVWDKVPDDFDTTSTSSSQGFVGAQLRTTEGRTQVTSAQHNDPVFEDRIKTNLVHSYE